MTIVNPVSDMDHTEAEKLAIAACFAVVMDLPRCGNVDFFLSYTRGASSRKEEDALFECRINKPPVSLGDCVAVCVCDGDFSYLRTI